MIRRPLFCMCVSLILGLLYGRKGHFGYVVLFGILMCVCGAALLHWSTEWKVLFVRTLICICLFGAGVAQFEAQQAVRDRLEEILFSADELTVQGQISRKETREHQFIYYLTDTQVILGGMTYPSFGILIYSSDGTYQPGNEIRVFGRYQPFQISRNEGNFNEKQYHQSKKQEFRLYADSVTLLQAKEHRFRVLLEKLRQRMRYVFQKSMKAEDAGVMANFALGDKSLIDQKIKTLYQKAGISHILAISGLHVSLFGMGLLGILKRLGCPRKFAALFALGAVYGFGLLSGMEISTGRAVGMFAVMMAADVFGNSYDSISAISLVAMVQLWKNPFLVEYAGFLFSYGAVLGVILVSGIVKNARKEERSQPKKKKKHGVGILRKGAEYWKETITVSVCIQLATLPLSLYFYYEIPVYGVFVNGCILPFMGVLLFLGFSGGILGCFCAPLGEFILKPASWILLANQRICQWSLSLFGSTWILGKPELAIVIGYYGMLVLCLYLVWRRRERRWLLGLVLAGCFFLPKKPSFEINILDVGQGDGVHIQTEDGEHFFVDGGSMDIREVGNYRILPYLKCKGISSIKAWMVSHADADHISGLKEILQQGYPVEYLILAKGMVQDEASKELIELAQTAGCQTVYVEPGMQFGTEDTVFTVLAPEATTSNLTAEEHVDRNGASLVIAVEHSGFTGLLTGDIGARQEQELVESACAKRYGISSIALCKAAHHGSDTSSCQEFLETFSPQIMVISCGVNNLYGHPGKEALSRMEAAKSKIFCTAQVGQIRIQEKEKNFQVWTYLP